MTPGDARLYEIAQRAHEAVFLLLKTMQPEGTQTLEDMADRAYAMRESSELFDRVKKDIDKLRDTYAKVCCARWIQTSDPENPKPIKTPHCTCTPTIKQGMTLPTAGTDPDNYNALCRDLGISEEAMHNDAMRLHWPGMTNLITARLNAGMPLPAGVKQNPTYPVFSLAIRKGEKPIRG